MNEKNLTILRGLSDLHLLVTLGRVFNGKDARFTMDDIEQEIQRRVNMRRGAKRDKTDE